MHCTSVSTVRFKAETGPKNGNQYLSLTKWQIVRKRPGYGGLTMSKPDVTPPTTHCKRTACDYYIRLSPDYMREALSGFRGKAAAIFFRQYTNELWEPPFCRLSCAEYGAFRRILSMFARSKTAISENVMTTTAKELKHYGISLRVLGQISAKLDQIEYWRITESGELNDLCGNQVTREGEGEGEGDGQGDLPAWW